MKIAMCCLLLAASAGSLCAVAGPATSGGEPNKRVVKFGDLDLNGSAGTAELYKRIRIAAVAVCEPASPRQLRSVELTEQCMEQAIARAIVDVNAPALTGYYLGKTARPITLAQR